MKTQEREPRQPSRRRQWLWWGWAVLGFVALSVGWERVAAGYSPEGRGMLRHGAAFLKAGADLGLALDRLPPPAAPRLAIFGSSQIAVVTDSDDPGDSMPARLSDALARRGVQHEIVDFSTGGQQISESMVILLMAGEQARVQTVLIGVSLFSMLRVEVRESLLAAGDVSATRAAVIDFLPANLPRADAESLLEFSRRAPQRVAARGETIQQRIDLWIGTRLENRFDAVANRRVLFDELVDAPIRRDLVAFVKRNLAGSRTARSYRIGPSYRPSLAALEVMARWCEERAVALQVALLPFDHDRPPVPFSPETMDRLHADLADLASRYGFRLVDYSELLGSQHFGHFVDGSPDSLHFDAAGHAALANALAEGMAGELERPPALSAR